MMKRTLAVALVLAPLVAGAEELKKLSLDNATVAGPRIESDSDIKVEGKSSIRITTTGSTVVSLGEVTDIDIENAKLVYSAQVKTELKGSAYLEMWVHLGKGEYFSKGLTEVVKNASGWTQIHAPFLLQKGQNPDKVRLNIVINGAGTVWVDDIVLSREPLK